MDVMHAVRHTAPRLSLVAILAVLAGACTSVQSYVEDAGFIYTDPPSRFNTVGSIFVAQKSLRNGHNVFSEVCTNRYFVRDRDAGKIDSQPGPTEVKVIEQISAKGSIDLTAKGMQALLAATDPSIKVNAELLVKSELTLSNIRYFNANWGYLGLIAVELGKEVQCGGTGSADDSMKKLRSLGVKTYHSQMVLQADANAKHTFKAGVSTELAATLSKVINASLAASGTIESESSAVMTGLNLGFRAWDPDCPRTRIDKVPNSDIAVGTCQ